MGQDIFTISKETYYDGFKGDALRINMQAVRDKFQYIGLWYAKDGNEHTSITTEIYSTMEESSDKPMDFTEELKENAFKQFNRHEISRSYNWVWVATRIDNSRYCRLKTGAMKKGKLYINFKVQHNKTYGFDVLGRGMFKGGEALFFPIGSEDMTGKIDYTDAIQYLVLINGLPPEDWNLDDTYIRIEHLPVFAPTFKFFDDRSYSKWEDQHPFDVIS